jgi:radical S-adenosyl methionine domain-containing protein 2
MVKERAFQEYRHVIEGASTVNYHLLKACNMSCGFCFATFRDNYDNRELSREESLELVDKLCFAGFRKINFAGGEPTLRKWLPDLIQRAKSRNATTSIVTNGSRITPDWLGSLEGCLGMIALSIDSVDPETQRRIGRVEKGMDPMSAEQYLDLSQRIRGYGIRLKVNTVVNKFNLAEDLTAFIQAMQPERWKIFQTLHVAGQNDERIDDFTITDSEFEEYVKRHRRIESSGITLVPETNDLMTGSYVMVDPRGRFFDNTSGRHTYSRPILEVGVTAALGSVKVYTERFQQRGGSYQ